MYPYQGYQGQPGAYGYPGAYYGYPPGQPGMMQPGMQQPGMQPNQAPANGAQPAQGQPAVPQPGQPQPGYGNMYPGMMYPGMMQPGMMQPGMMAPGMMGAPGMPMNPMAGMMGTIGKGQTTNISYEDADNACRRLYSAFKGLGTDDSEVVSVLSSYNKSQLNEISIIYAQKYGKNLSEALKSEISGQYLQLALAILYPPYKMESHFISEAIKKKSLEDADSIVEILGARTPADLQQIAAAYQIPAFGEKKNKKKKKQGKSFVQFVLDGTSGKKDLNNFSRAILTGLRPQTNVDASLASRDAKDLIIAAKGIGTDERTFFDIFAHRSFEHLRRVADEVKAQKGKSLEKLVTSEFSGVMERALLYILYMSKSPAHAAAYIIYRAVHGAGTRDAALIRTVAYIYDNDLCEKTKSAFREITGKDMIKYIEGDTSGNYKKLCVSLLNFRGKKLTVPLNVGYK